MAKGKYVCLDYTHLEAALAGVKMTFDAKESRIVIVKRSGKKPPNNWSICRPRTATERRR